jgi:hypothetical protein
VGGASFPTAPRVEGSGRTVLACPTPSRKRVDQPTRHLSRPRPASPCMADFVGSVACPWWPVGIPRCSPSPGSKGRADRPARQPEGARAMTEAAVSFAGNLTDDPELRHTEGGIARAMFQVAVSGRREQSRRSSPWSSGGTRPNMGRVAGQATRSSRAGILPGQQRRHPPGDGRRPVGSDAWPVLAVQRWWPWRRPPDGSDEINRDRFGSPGLLGRFFPGGGGDGGGS